MISQNRTYENRGICTSRTHLQPVEPMEVKRAWSDFVAVLSVPAFVVLAMFAWAVLA